jgi:hypothetical protein
MAGGMADTTSSSARHSGKKPSVARGARTWARAYGYSAIQGVAQWARGMPCLTMGMCGCAFPPRRGGRMRSGGGKATPLSVCLATPWGGHAPSQGCMAGRGETVGVPSALMPPSSGSPSASRRSQRNALRHWRWGIVRRGSQASPPLWRVQAVPQLPGGASCHSAPGCA